MQTPTKGISGFCIQYLQPCSVHSTFLVDAHNHNPKSILESKSMALFYVFSFFLFATTSASNENLRQPRRLQTYTQPSDYVALMLERVNTEREAQGLPTLCSNTKLQEAAQRHSDDQAANNFMNHTGSDGSSMSQRVTDAGYDWRGVAENVAAGQVDVDEVMDAWMNSEGHRHNILGEYTMLGTAYAYTSDGLYNHFWTQDFGRSDTEQCDDGSTPVDTDATSSSDQTQRFQPSSSSSEDNVMSAPNRRESRGTSTSSTTTLPVLLVGIINAAGLLLLY